MKTAKTFEDILNLYIAQRLPSLRKTTQHIYSSKFNYFFKSSLLKVKIKGFSAVHIDKWIDELLKHPTSQNKTRKNFKEELKLLSTILNWYRNYIDFEFLSPVVKRHRDKCIYKTNKPRRPDYFARPKEIRVWLKELRKSPNPVYGNLALFMVLTGVRVGEACGLLWSEVDFEKKFARIIRITSWDKITREPYLVEATKTDGSTRLVILPRVLIKMLRVMKKEALNEIVFSDIKGGFLKYTTTQARFSSAFKKLDLPWRGTHICRHTYATVALMATKDLSAVQASLGHQDQRVTQKYAKAIALLNSEMAEKTAKVFNLEEVD